MLVRDGLENTKQSGIFILETKHINVLQLVEQKGRNKKAISLTKV